MLQKSNSVDWSQERKRIWVSTRSELEAAHYKLNRYSGKRKTHWSLFEKSIKWLPFFLKAVGLYQRGFQNAVHIKSNSINLRFNDLPSAFDGYRILHLSDLHLDTLESIGPSIIDRIRPLSYDLCVITGDFRAKIYGGRFKKIMRPLQQVIANLHGRDGALAVLGNHDSYLMVDPLESLGLNVLINETVALNRNGHKLNITGIDDPHYYFTDQSEFAIEETNSGFKILLAHTPEVYRLAAENDYRLYLCGHSHGGQICLPGGIPIITHLYAGRSFYRGQWRFKKMQGYTSQGCGFVSIPIRFNTQSEVTIITLSKK
jgi:uncharacterized protein